MLDACDVVRKFRQMRGLSLRRLGRTSGVPETTIRRIESGVAPRVDVLAQLLDALRVDDETRLQLLQAEGT